MDKGSLLKKLDTMLDDAQRTARWGTIEIIFRKRRAR
jgi:hypothetical protein